MTVKSERSIGRIEAQAEEQKLSEFERNELIRKRVISLRLNDYFTQSGRSKSSRGLLIRAVRDYAIQYSEYLYKSGIKEKIITTLATESDDDIAKKVLSPVLTFYGNSQVKTKKKMRPADTQYFDVLEMFLDWVEYNFSFNHEYDFYKDVYEPGEVRLTEGIYKLERMSTLNPGWISASKLIIKKSVDIFGKNIFNEPSREYWGFQERKYSSSGGRDYVSDNRGRIIIRNSINYLFLGSSVHAVIQNDRVRKDIQLMNLCIKKYNDDMSRAEADNGSVKILTGVSLEATGGTKNIPFAARVRAVCISDENAEFSKEMFKQRKYDKDRDRYFTTPPDSSNIGIFKAF